MTECAKHELELFSSRPYQFSIIKTNQICLKPINTLTNATVLEFRDNSFGDTYKDLSSIFIRLKVKLSGALKEGENIGLSNCSMSSLFQQVQVFLNNTLISQNSSNYGYRAYFESIFNFTEDEASEHLEGEGFALDTPGQFDSVDVEKNFGFAKRSAMLKASEVEFVGRLHCDLLNQSKYLMNNVELRILFTLARPDFYIIANDKAKQTLEIMDASLYINHVTLNPEVLVAHHTVLQQRNAIYPYKKVEVKNFTIAPNASSFSIDNIILGTLPTMIIIGFVNTDRYIGSRSLNPYVFDHNKINTFEISINGVQLAQPLEMNYKEAGKYMSSMAYHQLFRGINYHRTDKAHSVTKELFDNGTFLLAYDLSPDHNDVCNNPLKTGSMRISARFDEVIDHSITVLAYLQYDAELLIDKDFVVYPTLY